MSYYHTQLIKGGPIGPKSFANLQLWLDADDDATITYAGAKSSAWADKSTIGNNAAQSNATYQFTPTPATINSRQVMATPSIGTYTANTGMAVTLTNGPFSAFTFGMLVQPRATTQVFTALVGSETNTGDITIETNGADATKLDAYINSVGASGATATGAFNTGTTYWILCTYSTPTLTIYANNSSILSTTTNLSSRQLAKAISIGGNTTVAGYKPLNSYLGEVLLYSAALSVGDQTSLYNGYVKPKWGTP